MKLEQQVVSLELAKRMKELGFEQSSLFYWDDGDGREDQLNYSPDVPLRELVSAYTVAELGEMLPSHYASSKAGYGGEFLCGELSKNGGYERQYKHDYTEADARAKMLIYLLENKLIDL